MIVTFFLVQGHFYFFWYLGHFTLFVALFTSGYFTVLYDIVVTLDGTINDSFELAHFRAGAPRACMEVNYKNVYEMYVSAFMLSYK